MNQNHFLSGRKKLATCILFLFFYAGQSQSSEEKNTHNKTVFEMNIAGLNIGMPHDDITAHLESEGWEGKTRSSNGRYKRNRDDGHETIQFSSEPYLGSPVATSIKYNRVFNKDIAFDAKAIYDSIIERYGAHPWRSTSHKHILYANYGALDDVESQCAKAFSKTDDIIEKMKALQTVRHEIATYKNSGNESWIRKNCPNSLNAIESGLSKELSPTLEVRINGRSISIKANWEEPKMLAKRQSAIDLETARKTNKPAKLDF